MVLIMVKKSFIKPFRVFDKFDSRSQCSCIHVAVKILVNIKYDMKQIIFIQRHNGVIKFF